MIEPVSLRLQLLESLTDAVFEGRFDAFKQALARLELFFTPGHVALKFASCVKHLLECCEVGPLKVLQILHFCCRVAQSSERVRLGDLVVDEPAQVCRRNVSALPLATLIDKFADLVHTRDLVIEDEECL